AQRTTARSAPSLHDALPIFRQMIGTEASEEGERLQEFLLAPPEERQEQIRELRERLGETELRAASPWWRSFLARLGIGRPAESVEDVHRRILEERRRSLEQEFGREQVDAIDAVTDAFESQTEAVERSTGALEDYLATIEAFHGLPGMAEILRAIYRAEGGEAARVPFGMTAFSD